uniref:Uncharacterized protein n=1 Tax=viral metagenome TaxID=1070528 RepID=A0A6C0CZW9_9ZZZZ
MAASTMKNVKNMGKTWTEEEENQLRTELKSGMSISTISTIHGRSPRAIELRLMCSVIHKECPREATSQDKKNHLIKTYRRSPEDAENLLSLSVSPPSSSLSSTTSPSSNYSNYSNYGNMQQTMQHTMQQTMQQLLSEMKEQTRILQSILNNTESLKRHTRHNNNTRDNNNNKQT